MGPAKPSAGGNIKEVAHAAPPGAKPGFAKPQSHLPLAAGGFQVDGAQKTPASAGDTGV